MILVMIVTGPLGNVLLGKGMKHVGAMAIWPPSQLLHTGLKIFASPSIWLRLTVDKAARDYLLAQASTFGAASPSISTGSTS